MSNHEIEDVLSSIRRLVSDDLRPTSSRMGATATAAAARVAPEPEPEPEYVEEPTPASRLLLTPAFRVVKSADEPAPEIVPDQGGDVHDAPADDFAMPEASDVELQGEPAPSRAHDVIASFGASADASDENWESPVGDVEEWAEEVWSAQGVPEGQDDLPEDEPQEIQATVAPAFVHRVRDAFRYEVQPEFDADEEDAEADDDGAGIEPPVMVKSAVDELQIRPRMMIMPTEKDAKWADAAEAAAIADLEQDQDDQAEEVTGEARAEFAPGYTRTAAATSTAQVSDAVADSVIDEFADEISDELADTLPQDGPQELSFDEDVLRGLVRDIIREELSGSLGERITRNVRKLVRAEIARALSVREFE